MSLDYVLTNIPNWESRCRVPHPELDGKYRLNPTTEAIIFATMSAGMGEITEKNYIEFWMRVAASDAISQWPKGTPITLDDVRAHIGLRTNVSLESRTSWLKRHFDGTEREIRYRIRRDAEAAEKEKVDA